MAVSINWGGAFCGRPYTRALLFRVYIGTPDFWKLPRVCVLYRYARRGASQEKTEQVYSGLHPSSWILLGDKGCLGLCWGARKRGRPWYTTEHPMSHAAQPPCLFQAELIAWFCSSLQWAPCGRKQKQTLGLYLQARGS